MRLAREARGHTWPREGEEILRMVITESGDLADEVGIRKKPYPRDHGEPKQSERINMSELT